MRPLLCAIIAASLAAVVSAQPGGGRREGGNRPNAAGGQRDGYRNRDSAYQPVVPVEAGVTAYGAYGYEGGATTAAGSALSGMASAISAAGDYNLSTSAAAVNMTQAQRQEIENRQQATTAYFDMRATNRAARAAEAGPKPTMEQMVRIAQSGIPKPLDPAQMNPVNGQLSWPTALQAGAFDGTRAELDQLLNKKATYGTLGYSDQTKARETIDEAFAQLKSQIREIPPQDYVASRDFLRRLMYAACRTELN